MDLSRAELRFGLSDPRGLGANPRVTADGKPLRLQPGGGSSGGRGFFAWIDAGGLTSQPLAVDFAFDFRGNGALSLAPQAGDTRWTVRSSWPSPSFGGDFLPGNRQVANKGFAATYRIGNLALGRSLVSTGDRRARRRRPPSRTATRDRLAAARSDRADQPDPAGRPLFAGQPRNQIRLPVHWLHLPRAADVRRDRRRARVGGRISADGRGAGLFFVLLLAFAEVIGFTAAYILASAAIAGLNTAYSAAVLASWRRAGLHRRAARRPLRGALHPAQPRGLLAADRFAAAVRCACRRDVRDSADRLGRDGGKQPEA